MIYSKQPIEVIYDYIKDLEIPIYKNYMDEDENSVPESYILLKAQTTDNPEVFGDGQTLVRVADCEITLFSKGAATTSTNIHNVNLEKIKQSLVEKNINFSFINLGYNKDLKNSQGTFEIRVKYSG